MDAVQLSVRQLVEFLLLTGSIDSRFSGPDRALEGARIHRWLQKKEGPDYQPEVYLRWEQTVEEVPYRIDGRADGVYPAPDGVICIDEIKTTTLPCEQITPDHSPVHWAQAKVYAAILAAQKGLSEMGVRLTYFQVDEERLFRFEERYSADELQEFFLDLLRQYAPWAKRSAAHHEARGVSLRGLTFPFDGYRAGQREMAAMVYRAMRDGKRVFCQAPTGIGKTMSALFPALKALGEGHGERVFYLTARTTTRQAARDALELLHQNRGPLELNYVVLTAKDKICPRERRECNPEACPLARGYFDRRRDALWRALEHRHFDRETIERLAETEQLCPFEFGLDISLWCDAIVGDYNYLFDPTARLQRFFEGGDGQSLFLVDEAHNLPDRAREMYSSRLEKEPLYAVRKALGGRGKLARALAAPNTAFVNIRHESEEKETRSWFTDAAPEEFLKAVRHCTAPMQQWLEEHRGENGGELYDQVLDAYFTIKDFLRTADRYDEHYATQYIAAGSRVRVELICLDPSLFVDESLALGRGAALFSATLTPLPYYRDVLGCGEAAAVSLPSPFDPGRMGLFCALDVDTRYARREQSLDRVTDYLAVMAAGRVGNYLAYFPSYGYMEQVRQRFCERYPEIEILVQDSGMSEEERAAFLDNFREEPDKTLLGFCVMGGVFGEGIDLTGSRLIGTAVVGVGLPQVNPRQEMLRDYFARTREDGFAYAYQYPGFNKVMQAAGRVIRTPDDRGVVLLLDSRFGTPGYRRLFPGYWQHCRDVRGADMMAEQLAEFWRREDEDPQKGARL